MPPFIPGLELARRFYHEAVRPVLDGHFPGLAYDAALIGPGSEILGFDTPMSRDHHWGPRAMLFLSEADAPAYAPRLAAFTGRELPDEFLGYPTGFRDSPGEPGVLLIASDPRGVGEVRRRIDVTSVRRFVQDYLNFDPAATDPISPADWLTFPEQRLRTLTGGAIFHSGLGDVAAMQARLAYFPHDVWLYLMAAGWQRLAEEEPFMGRTADNGDEIGSRLLTARLVHDVMRLCFLMERQYAPYAKWFGTAFARLACAAEMRPALDAALAAGEWREREAHLCRAYVLLARMHNALGLTAPLPDQVSHFHGRPFLVIHGERFADALIGQIRDPAVRAIAARTRIGNLDTFSDNTSLCSYPSLRPAIRTLFE
ncbi:MAG: DUF4037 domain-containing protein [Anaerolineae bacterium]|nr:DUF4037 domain-containing protein [Anaerolineae bacterium]